MDINDDNAYFFCECTAQWRGESEGNAPRLKKLRQHLTSTSEVSYSRYARVLIGEAGPSP